MADVNIAVKVPALEKLLDYMASAIGAVAGPVVARLTARMRAKTQLIEAEGDAAALGARSEGKADVLSIYAKGHHSALEQIARAQSEARNQESTLPVIVAGEVSIGDEIELRITFQEHKRQSNIYNVLSMAADELRDKEVNDHEVDHDWTARFFSGAQDVTSEQMQCIWAKILAGEVETPGRTSLHALAILRNMSQRDAEMFARAARFVMGDFILGDTGLTNHIDNFPSYSDLLELSSYGLLSIGADLRKEFSFPSKYGDISISAFPHGDVVYALTPIDGQAEICSIPAHSLTGPGRQIYVNIDAELDKEYLHSVAKYLKETHETQLLHGTLVNLSQDGRLQFDQLADVLSGNVYQDSPK